MILGVSRGAPTDPHEEGMNFALYLDHHHHHHHHQCTSEVDCPPCLDQSGTTTRAAPAVQPPSHYQHAQKVKFDIQNINFLVLFPC